MTYNLTPADLMDLRAKMRSIGTLRDGNFEPNTLGVPYVVVSVSTQEFALHSGGAVVAVSTRPEVIAWCLLQERVKPGYVRSILRPDLAPDLALSPELLAKRQREDAAFNATLRRAEAEEEARLERRRTQLHQKPASEFTLDDL